MSPLIVLVVFLLGFGLGVLVSWIRPKPTLDKHQQYELSRLEDLEGRIMRTCMEHATEPISFVIIDDINASRRTRELRRRDR